MIEPDLTDDERFLLSRGVMEWGGPARVTDELAVAMGFAGRDGLFAEYGRLYETAMNGAMSTAHDWARILVMTEFVFVSDVFGSGHDWHTTTGLDDIETIGLLRGVQHKLLRAGVGRTQFGPTSFEERRWQHGARAALRLYERERLDLDGLLEALEHTESELGADVESMRSFRDAAAGAQGMREEEARRHVLAAAERLTSFLDRDVEPSRMRWTHE